VAWVGLVMYFGHYDQITPPEWLRLCMRVVYATMQWCALLAVIGFARRHLDHDHAWRRYLTDAVFPVYILHQTLIVLIAMALRPAAWPAWLEGPVLIAATFVLSFAGYELVRRVAVLRPWFGLASAAPAQRLQGGAPSAARP
jgi:glucan biosynthesis protein C